MRFAVGSLLLLLSLAGMPAGCCSTDPAVSLRTWAESALPRPPADILDTIRVWDAPPRWLDLDADGQRVDLEPPGRRAVMALLPQRDLMAVLGSLVEWMAYAESLRLLLAGQGARQASGEVSSASDPNQGPGSAGERQESPR